MDYSPPLPALLENSACRSPDDALIHEETEALAQLTPPDSPTSSSETGSQNSTVDIDLPNPLPLPSDDDIKAPHPQFTLWCGHYHSITMMEVIGPSPKIQVGSVMQPFAVRAVLNPLLWKNSSLEILVCLHRAKTEEHVTKDVLAGDTIITGVQSKGLGKHGKPILVFDFSIIGLQILREGLFYFTYAFLDPRDETRAFWDLTGSACKATRHPDLLEHEVSYWTEFERRGLLCTEAEAREAGLNGIVENESLRSSSASSNSFSNLERGLQIRYRKQGNYRWNQ